MQPRTASKESTSPTPTEVPTDVEDNAHAPEDADDKEDDAPDGPLLLAPRFPSDRAIFASPIIDAQELLRLREGPSCIVSLNRGAFGSAKNIRSYVSKSVSVSGDVQALKGLFTEVSVASSWSIAFP